MSSSVKVSLFWLLLILYSPIKARTVTKSGSSGVFWHISGHTWFHWHRKLYGFFSHGKWKLILCFRKAFSFCSHTVSWSAVAWFYLMIVWFFTVFLTEWIHFLGNVKFVSWLADVGWPVVSAITDAAAASVWSVLSQV